VRPAAGDKRIEVKQVIEPMPALLGDARVVRQMLLNLLSNAVKYTPEGGRVTLRARIGRGGGAVLEVADSGIGIPADQVPHLLEPFTRADDSYTQTQQGTGLGLTLTKRMIEAHGGLLNIVSTPGEGSEISLVFPPARTTPRGD
jgi:signal transduction histidine kinase